MLLHIEKKVTIQPKDIIHFTSLWVHNPPSIKSWLILNHLSKDRPHFCLDSVLIAIDKSPRSAAKEAGITLTILKDSTDLKSRDLIEDDDFWYLLELGI